MSKLLCPVCALPLSLGEKAAVCEKGHSFDRAAQGYFNLVLNAKAESGDSSASVVARHRFLSNGYYDSLASHLSSVVTSLCPEKGVFLDACCGEGYFTKKAADALNAELYAFDLSKKAVKTASASFGQCTFFTANISKIPLPDASVDLMLHIFAPVNDAEFYRILKNDGVLIHVFPAARHLWQLKALMYEKPYENDEKPDISDSFTLVSSERVTSSAELDRDSLNNLVAMTPYLHRTPKSGLDALENAHIPFYTETGFIINIYKKGTLS